jgi:hypothetical protein
MESNNSTQAESVSPEQAAMAILESGQGQAPEGGEPAPKQEGVKIDFDKVAENERRLYRERQKWSTKTKQMEARIKELEAKIAESGKAPVIEEEDDLDPVEKEMRKYLDETPLTKEEFLRMKEEEAKQSKETEDKELQRLEFEYNQEKAANNVISFIEKQAEQFPILAEQQNSELILEVLGQDYDQKVEEFGEEFAMKNILPLEKACQLAEKYLESQLETMLKSERMSKLLKAKMGQNSQHLSGQQQEPRTLSNDFYESTSAHGELSEDERIKRAMAVIS